ncbi:TetR/AcrR family transcriptional regulator, partial [uncultured Duncaniella sp.]|uniref:TetR/AcrR family transcriptional regulator n=1 Tax=uncultured Duncaniella sp. TaxID=2768039 RepID=UPI00267737C4
RSSRDTSKCCDSPKGTSTNFTRKAIQETFITLLDERPLNKITVKDIVETCGINRNSFYYHYQDLPALLEEIIAQRVQLLMSA